MRREHLIIRSLGFFRRLALIGRNVKLLVGDEWSEDRHDVKIQDPTGRRPAKARLDEGAAGGARLHELIAARRSPAACLPVAGQRGGHGEAALRASLSAEGSPVHGNALAHPDQTVSARTRLLD